MYPTSVEILEQVVSTKLHELTFCLVTYMRLANMIRCVTIFCGKRGTMLRLGFEKYQIQTPSTTMAAPESTRHTTTAAESQAYTCAPPSCSAKTRGTEAMMNNKQPTKSSCRRVMRPGDGVFGQETRISAMTKPQQGRLK
jgi:hypothetical protein